MYVQYLALTLSIVFTSSNFGFGQLDSLDYYLDLSEYEKSIYDIYLRKRDKRYIIKFDDVDFSKISNRSITCFAYLIRGDYYLYGPKRLDDKASKNYLIAFNISKSMDDDFIESETLYKIIKFQIYTGNLLFDTESLIDNRELLIKSKHSHLENDYLRLKNQYITAKDTLKMFQLGYEWQDFISELRVRKYQKLKSDSEEILADLLHSLDDIETSIYYLEESLKSALLFSKNYFEEKTFKVNANLIFSHLELGNYNTCIEKLISINPKLIRMQGPDELSIFYGWISEAYKGLDKQDSALHYLELKHQMDKLADATVEAQNVSKIKSQYEKEKHESELSIWRRRLMIAASLVFLFSGVAYGSYRFQSIKKKAALSELEKTKIQATLDVTKAKMQGEQEERKIIASVLHDQVASLLTAADMHLAAAKKTGDPSDSRSIEKADEIIKDVNEQVRNLSHQLVSPTLLKFGLVPAIDSLVEKMQNDKIRFSFQFDEGGERIDSSKEIFLFRACSELMQNALKYSNGDSAIISLDQDAELITLVVHDNGALKSTELSEDGLGLAHIKNNTEALLGQFFIDQQDGFKVSISIPVS